MNSRKATLIRPCTASALALQRLRQGAAEEGDERAEDREDQHPQQHRAFVVPPDPGNLVDRRGGAVGVLRDVEHGEIRDEMGVDERGEGDRETGELGQRRASSDRHQVGVAEARAPGRHDRLRQRGGEGENEGEMADLDDHLAFAPSCQRPCFFSDFDDLARHVALVVLGENLVAGDAARSGEHALDDDALALAEEVRNVGEARAEAVDRDGLRAIGHDEGEAVVGAGDRALLDQSADPEPRPRLDVLFGDFGGSEEQRQAVLHRVKAEADGAADHRQGGGDQGEAAALPGQLASPRPRSRASASRLATALASGPSALRASASAALALSP